MNLCILQSTTASLTETFIRAHGEFIPENITVVQGLPVRADGRVILANTITARTFRAVRRTISSVTDSEMAYQKILREMEADAVLAEYGMSGVDVMRVCETLEIPLVVHFHGYDSCRQDVLFKYAESYHFLFAQAAAIIAVSRAMRHQLIELGAPSNKVFYNPYGVDCDLFEKSEPAIAPPIFIAVGRFVEKKAPHLLLLAFAQVHHDYPDARLRIIGNGPLLSVCKDLAQALKIEDAVTFLGAQPHHVVRDEMSRARAFVQHSIVADNGDSEGTPNSILEAGAAGLPVISTRHAGIPDVVVNEETGLLVDEKDVPAMAEQMKRLLHSPELAQRLGAAGRKQMERNFRMEQSIARLTAIIRSCVNGGARPPLDRPPLDVNPGSERTSKAVESRG